MKYLLLLLASVALWTTPALAQGQEGDDFDAASVLVPSGAWLVGPTTLIDGSAVQGGVPCVMVNKYNNNMELRFSGGGEEILALALNVGSASFTPDQNYLINIGFDGVEPLGLLAQAFNEDTVVIGTEPGKEVYKYLKEKPSMIVRLGDSVMEFSLLGVPQGLRRLEECFAPKDKATTMAAPAPQVAPQVVPQIAPQVAPNQVAPTQVSPTQAVAQIAPTPAPVSSETLDEVSAQQVKSLMDQIKGGASARVAPSQETQTAPTTAQKVAQATQDAQQEAQQQAQQQPAQQQLSAPAPQQVKSQDILAPGAATTVMGEGQQMRWRVMKGANLQNILEVWAASAQAQLIWKTNQSFSVPESLALQGTFEAAVEAVLAQYPTSDKRPVGKIYRDPQVGQKILVIEDLTPQSTDSGAGNYAPINYR